MVKGLQFSLFSVQELSKIKTSEISPVDLIEYCFEFNPSLNAFITILDENDAYNNARIAEKEISHGNYRGPLHGIPFSISSLLKVLDALQVQKYCLNIFQRLMQHVLKELRKRVQSYLAPTI